MADTSIEWTQKTWNPVRGCSRVSPGCDNCYAMGQAHRFSGAGGPYEGLTTIRRSKVDWAGSARLVPEQLAAPLSWRKPQRIFVNSMSDLFHESLSNEDIAAVFGVMAACPQHTFQVLTKRPKRMAEWFRWLKEQQCPPVEEDLWTVLIRAASGWLPDKLANQLTEDGIARDGVKWREPWPLPNVWLGVSVENQEQADQRIPLLLETPAAVRFISAEPLLGPVDIRRFVRDPCDCLVPAMEGAGQHSPNCATFRQSSLDWVIVGGESGHSARLYADAWAEDVIRQCRTASVAVFHKQRGAVTSDGRFTLKIGKKEAADPAMWPESLRVRQFPGGLA